MCDIVSKYCVGCSRVLEVHIGDYMTPPDTIEVCCGQCADITVRAHWVGVMLRDAELEELADGEKEWWMRYIGRNPNIHEHVGGEISPNGSYDRISAILMGINDGGKLMFEHALVSMPRRGR